MINLATIDTDDKTSQFVTAIYNLFLHREPDQGGLKNHYINFCSALSIDECLSKIVNCPERQRLLKMQPNSKPICPTMDYSNILQYAIDRNCTDTYIDAIKIEYALTFADYRDGLQLINTEDNRLQLEYRIRLINQLGIDDLITQEYVFLDSAAKFGWDIMSSRCALSINLEYLEKKIADSSSTIQEALSEQKNSLKNSLSFLSDSISSLLIDNLESISPERIISLFESIMSIKGFTKSEKKICTKILCTIFYGEPISHVYVNKSEKRRLTFLAGFYFSGSSAVYDFFRGNSYFCDGYSADCFPLKNEHEILFIATKYGFVDIFRAMHSNEAALKTSIVRFVLYHVLAWHVPLNVYSKNSRIHYPVVHAFINSHQNFKNYLIAIEDWIKDVLSIAFKDKYKEHYSFIFQKLVLDLIELLHGKHSVSKCYIMNNAIMAHAVQNCLHIFPQGTTYIAIFRDPRDHYISNIEHNCLANVTEYIDLMKANLGKLSNTNTEFAEKYRIIPVSYERFVQDENYRFQLANKLGCSEKFESPYFDPTFSITRIGKYKNHEDQNAVRQVEAAFPELMSGEYFLQFKENF